MGLIIAISYRKTLTRLSLFFITCVVLSGCVSPGRMIPPNEGDWGQDGYSLEKTRGYMYEVCDFGHVSNREEGIEFEKCMIEGGFNFLDGRHDERLKEEGYMPTSRDAYMCKYRWLSNSYDRPGCQQYRAREGIE